MADVSRAKPRNPIAKLARSLAKRVRRLREGGDERRFLSQARGIVHVGANSGQEAPSYARLGVPVFWIEPLPDVFAVLQERISSHPLQTAVRALVSDSDGAEVDFHVAGESSSMFAFAEHKKLWPEIDASGILRLTTSRLDTLMQAHGLSSPPYDALVIDTQGAELLVLKGAGDRLAGFERIVAEAADFEAYRGATNVEELTAFLAGHGFGLQHKASMASLKGVGTYYNLYFKRSH